MASPRARPWLLFAFAVACGGVAAFLALRYLRERATPILRAETPRNRVVLAAKDLPVGAVVTENDIRLVDWPGDATPPGFIGGREQVVGRGVLTAVRTNEPFLETKLAPRGTGGGMPTLITDGMRALSVKVDEVVGVAGFVIPGTRVDVLLTMNQRTPTGEPTTRAILQNVQALASGQSIQSDAEGKPRPVSVVTLLVTPAQAETLALAAGQGRIQMALRNVLDTTEVLTPGARAGTLLSSETPVVVRNRRAVRAPARQNQQAIVEGFRGGERTVSRFSERRP